MRGSCLIAVALFACSSAPFEGLAPARDQGGPKVRFDLFATPLPEVPFPTDILTRPDPVSPTGRRLNASLVAPSLLQGNLASALDTLDGFGTFAPLTVAFDRPIDVLDLFARQNDADPANDGVYLVDLGTGAQVPLDFGGGRFPYTSIDPGRYFPADPDAATWNLLFPASGPFANFLHPQAPHLTAREQADDLLAFYERETNTLIARPVLPLRQRARYAVVLTSRIHGLDGRPISSPHPGINHAAQTQELQPLLSRLPQGTRLEDVAYAWAFTTQSITGDLELIRRGLYGQGPLQRLAVEYPVELGFVAHPRVNVAILQERGTFVKDQQSGNKADYILPAAALQTLVTDPAVQGLPFAVDPADAALLDTWKYVDYFVSGTFAVPSFVDGPGGRFWVDPAAGNVFAREEAVTFLLAVPKQVPQAGHLAPFPLVLAGHDFGSNRFAPAFAFAGTFAKFGVATLAFDAHGHGLALDAAQQQTLRDAARAHGLEAFAEAMLQGRARDLDGDGVPDPGADDWTADAFHSRDVLRQSAVDWMQAIRLLRSFDGTSEIALGSGGVVVGGDFNDDGVPDVGGPATFAAPIFEADRKTHAFERGDPNPGADLFAFGTGLGGITAAIVPGVEPDIVATAPASSAGGLADVALRTTLPGLLRPVLLGLMGPLVVTCPFDRGAGPIDPATQAPLGACGTAGESTLALVIADPGGERDIPVASLTPSPGQQVMVRNLEQAPPGADCRQQKTAGCAAGTADAQGRVRLSIAADPPSLVVPQLGSTARPGDRLEVLVFDAGGAEQRRIVSFEVESRFSGADHQGTALFSPGGGFGLARNTPAFRRMMGLTQLVLDPADPANYASGYASRGALLVGTAGDPVVPVGATVALARAAGVVPAQADPDYGVSLEEVLIRSGAVEGVPATRRFDDPAGGAWAALPGHLRCDPGADCTGDALADVGGYSCSAGTCTDGLQAPRLDPPLQQKLVRQSAPAGPCPVNKRAKAPGCYSAGASACTASAPAVSALLLPLLARSGQHAFAGPNAQSAFDMDQFIANAVGRFFECRGRELRFDECQQDLARCAWIPPPP